ncbi:S26 family signal peptidase [Fodinicola feengrottensis]|uniref:S26 family signal peptidase n=2 Tax=Fodinicola feengrottensis TaxID=435914 RepID=A0ABN2H9E1_9ACTN|nr:S26 family signal peptidase [Fodinicola feengrottensis]
MSRKLIAVIVRGVSMEPTYRDGDRVLARRGHSPVVGQVVVVEIPTGSPVGTGGWMIKRVVAVAGDPVPRDRADALADVPEDRVPAGKIVLVGDNPAASYDSRTAGYFRTDRVLGIAIRRLAP